MLIIELPCDCVWCQDIRKMHKDIYGNPEVRNRIGVVNRRFEARMIRIGRANGVPNHRMRNPKMDVMGFFKALLSGEIDD